MGIWGIQPTIFPIQDLLQPKPIPRVIGTLGTGILFPPKSPPACAPPVPKHPPPPRRWHPQLYCVLASVGSTGGGRRRLTVHVAAVRCLLGPCLPDRCCKGAFVRACEGGTYGKPFSFEIGDRGGGHTPPGRWGVGSGPRTLRGGVRWAQIAKFFFQHTAQKNAPTPSF